MEVIDHPQVSSLEQVTADTIATHGDQVHCVQFVPLYSNCLLLIGLDKSEPKLLDHISKLQGRSVRTAQIGMHCWCLKLREKNSHPRLLGLMVGEAGGPK